MKRLATPLKLTQIDSLTWESEEVSVAGMSKASILVYTDATATVRILTDLPHPWLELDSFTANPNTLAKYDVPLPLNKVKIRIEASSTPTVLEVAAVGW